MDAYIIKGYRTAVTKAKKGGFKHTRSDDLAAHVVRSLVQSVEGLEHAEVEDIIVGNALPEAEQGMQIGRHVALMSLGIDVPGFVINRYCGSGLEAIALATSKIHTGQCDCVIAGGMESMSMVPMTGYKPAVNWKLVSEHADYLLSMGLTAEKLSDKYNISREDADMFSYQSHQKALQAIEAGRFEDEIIPYKVDDIVFSEGKKKTISYVVDTDEGPRKDTTPEALSKLKPAFKAKGTVTAGNSSQTSDGAAFVLLVSEALLKKLNVQPVAKLLSYAVGGVDPSIMGIGPVKAIPKALKKAGLSLQDIEQIELNEAFASQSLSVIKELDMNKDIVNVNGGAVALGHPLGCTGAKLSIQLMNEMKRRKQKYGMVTACVGGGQGVAGVFEMC